MENLALFQPTWEQYPWPDKTRDFGSEKAVDGMYTDRGVGGQCTISEDGKNTATWRVDLGRVVSISHIDIYYRTDNRNNSQNLDRIAGFFVYVSNTTSKDDGYLCYHDELTDRFMLSEDQHINCTLLGRYVIYYNERKQSVQYPSFYSNYAYNELCEVEVYGCKGIYGDDCIYPCPANCKDRRCDTNAGHCLSCSSGYKGLECHIVCNNNTYGPECALKCGNCSNGETCHHINGTCLHGCAEGALGDTCQEGCQSGYYRRNCSHRCSENCIVTSQCDRFTGRCGGGCKQGWTGNTCDELRATDTQTSSCTETYTIVIVMVSVLIVVTGSLINFVIWKRNVEKLSIMSRGTIPQPTNKTVDMDQYIELEEVDKCKTYEEIHSYSN
nr:multiple epidermal growth factor-like domains protein 10 [Crassostrea gigas]